MSCHLRNLWQQSRIGTARKIPAQATFWIDVISFGNSLVDSSGFVKGMTLILFNLQFNSNNLDVQGVWANAQMT